MQILYWYLRGDVAAQKAYLRPPGEIGGPKRLWGEKTTDLPPGERTFALRLAID
jgi:hypothetical protein